MRRGEEGRGREEGERCGGRRERGEKEMRYKEKEPCVKGLQVPATVNSFVAFKTGE